MSPMHRDENGAAKVQDKTKPKKRRRIEEYLKLYRIQFVKVKRNVNKHFDGISMETTDDYILLLIIKKIGFKVRRRRGFKEYLKSTFVV